MIAICLLAACGEVEAPEGAALGTCTLAVEPPDDCDSLDAQLAFVERAMFQHYLFNDQLASDIEPSGFEDLSSYLNALVEPVQPEDRFSFITTIQQEQDRFVAGRSLGFGFSLAFDDEGRLRFRDVFGAFPDEPPSSASAAGLVRGDEIVAIDGRPLEDIFDEGLGDVLSAPEPGESLSFTIRKNSGAEEEVVLVRDFFTLDPVPISRRLEIDGTSVGYLFVRTFTQPTVPELEAAFESFSDVDVLVIDFRYNGGGLLSTAEAFGDLIAGDLFAGEVFYATQLNENNAACEDDVRFGGGAGGLSTLREVIFITTGGTASASEVMINGLRPFLPVRLVGGATFGKPVGQAGFGFCDFVLRPTTFKLVNADGSGDFFDGIPADCIAFDDLDHAFGDPDEGMLASALSVVTTGVCPSDKARLSSSVSSRRGPVPVRRPGSSPEEVPVF